MSPGLRPENSLFHNLTIDGPPATTRCGLCDPTLANILAGNSVRRLATFGAKQTDKRIAKLKAEAKRDDAKVAGQGVGDLSFPPVAAGVGRTSSGIQRIQVAGDGQRGG